MIHHEKITFTTQEELSKYAAKLAEKQLAALTPDQILRITGTVLHHLNALTLGAASCGLSDAGKTALATLNTILDIANIHFATTVIRKQK